MKEAWVYLATHQVTSKSIKASLNSLIRKLNSLERSMITSISFKDSKIQLQLSEQSEETPVKSEVTSSKEKDHYVIVAKPIAGLTSKTLSELLQNFIQKMSDANIIDGMQCVDDIQCNNNQLSVRVEKKEEKPATLNESYRRKNLLIIDGSNLLARGYFATSFRGNLMRNQEGLFTNGVYVFVKKMLRLIQSLQVTHLVICWDIGRADTFRRNIYSDYKALREETEPELKEQYKTVEELLRLMNIPQLRLDPYEADDLIGTISTEFRKISSLTDKCYIYSNDKDMFQLLDPEIKVQQIINKNKQDLFYSSMKFEEEYGIKPSQWVDVKAILGEKGKSSDNIPGCHGVGEKAAFPLVKQYKTLEGIYKNIETLDKSFSRYKKKLEDGKSDTMLSRKLAKIVCDIPMLNDFTKYELKINHSGKDKAFRWLNFR
ncbi:5'-3' exonuclease [Salipaludibacillus sp. HK11]|uniref:5'-3' exonuclease n=1 Tax=Salipaludibacillus sp. HK11 TaxID=3394320 RepID=UPI0039FBD369